MRLTVNADRTYRRNSTTGILVVVMKKRVSKTIGVKPTYNIIAIWDKYKFLLFEI
jgi:hypothetical protein